MSKTLHYDARAKQMWAAPSGWLAIVDGKRWPVAMFCLVSWYDGGDHSTHATLACINGRMRLAEQEDKFERIEPPASV